MIAYVPDPLNHPLTVAFPYFPVHERKILHQDLEEILTGKLSAGHRTEEFENKFAAFCGAKHGVAFQSGTAALESSLIALGAKAGDEILVPVETFIATGMAVHAIGAKPVFTEVDPETFGMDFQYALSRIGPKTRGAIVVHFGGMISPELPEFVAELRKRGLFVIEDAAHAHGSELGGLRAGAIGDAACFSFYPTKIMTTGEGGMVTTNREDIDGITRSIQNHGRDLSSPVEIYSIPGHNNRFTEMAAAMGLSQLRCLPEFLKARRAIATIYDTHLGKEKTFTPVSPGKGSLSAYWRYVIVPRVNVDRKKLRTALAEDGIHIDWAYEPALHLQPVFRSLFNTAPGMLPGSEALLSKHICIPVHARMRAEDAQYVVERLIMRTKEVRV